MVYRKGKRALLFLAALLAGVAYCCISGYLSKDALHLQNAKPQGFYCYVNGKEGVAGTQITEQRVNGERYLFLPSGMDLSALNLHFSCPKGETVLFQNKKVRKKIRLDVYAQGDYNAKKAAYRLTLKIRHADTSEQEYPLWIMASKHIPSVFFVSENQEENGRAWVEEHMDHSNVAEAFVYEMDPNGSLICKQKAQKLRIRGNFTASAEKKAYQIKLRSKEDMLGIGEPAKRFAFLANAYDTSLQHNTISYHLGKELGMDDTPDCRPVDVYYDGEYMGNYLLTELPDLSPESIAIREEGSYLMQIDYAHYEDQKHYLSLENGMYVAIEKPEECTQEQLSYLTQIWEELIATVQNGGVHPENQKTIEDYLDLESYARYYLVQQFAKNPDGFSSSTYCYIPYHENKIYFCALWDFDLCYGIDHQIKSLVKPTGYYPDNIGADFSTIPVVSQKIKDIYDLEFRDIIEKILLGDGSVQGEYLKSLEEYREEIEASQRMNYTLWDLNQTTLTEKFLSYEESLRYLREFIQKRNQWMERAISGWTGCDAISDVEFAAERHLAGMPVDLSVRIKNKWCGGIILSTEFVEQETYFERGKEYHLRVLLASQRGSRFSEQVTVKTNLGTVESQTPFGDERLEVVINVGAPKEVNTVYQGINYAPVYNKEYYLEHYKEVAELVGTSDEAALEYFVTEGMKQAHQGCEDFDVKVYYARYPLFDGWEYSDLYMHYLTEGLKEGWSGKL